jgi:polyferredoxin
MRKYKSVISPFLISLAVAAILYLISKWWVFLLIFPWIGLSVSIGIYLRLNLKGKKKILGRKISLFMILPCLLFFVPIINNENFQLEGVILIVTVGFFSKGFIHYAVAKLFGPLIWRRGFCAYACWTAAVLDFLPIKSNNCTISKSFRNIRFISLAISLIIPLYLILALSYNPYTDYINKAEMKWMFISNAIYYAIAVPLAFILSDKRAFCKYVCPVSLVMKPASSVGLLKIKPNIEAKCTECKICNSVCPMGVDVMSFMKKNTPINDTECILCGDCQVMCPTKKIL